MLPKLADGHLTSTPSAGELRRLVAQQVVASWPFRSAVVGFLALATLQLHEKSRRRPRGRLRLFLPYLSESTLRPALPLGLRAAPSDALRDAAHDRRRASPA